MFITWSKLLDVLNNGMPDLSRVEIRYSGEMLTLRPKTDVNDPNEVVRIDIKILVQNFSITIPDGTFRDDFFKLLGETHQLILREVGPLAPRNTEENFEFQLWDRNGKIIG